jgi:23S rRNA (adenine2503-C2)-methyltransferase
MEIRKIEEILKEEEPPFRLKQVKKAIFNDLIEDWDEATTLPKNLRQKLSKNCPIQELKTEKVLASKNGQTIKALFGLKDGLKIESVLMRHIDGRRTVCVSSQVGCAMKCSFCVTGQQGFKRNLSSSEIIDQVLFFARFLKKSREKVTNIVFMGMGEPFLNYNNVLEAIRILNDKDGFNLGARHISISTAGIVEGIEKLAKEKLQVNLAISLHSPNNNLRTKLMPINKKYPIEKILVAVDDYIKKTKRRIMFEYLMINGANDNPKEAKELAKLLRKPLYFVNLISFNPTGHSQFKPSPGWKIKKFKEILEKNGIAVTQRYRFGREIKAACGQLAGHENADPLSFNFKL